MILEDIQELNFNLEDYSKLFSLYKEDLANYIKAISSYDSDTSSIAQRFLLNKLEEKWMPILGFNSSRIINDIGEIQTPKTHFVRSLNVKEALTYYNDGQAWIIPNLLRKASMYLLAGEPKAGKSLLIYFLLHSIAVSGNFLGRPTQTGNVLYLQLEESLETIGERLFMAGFGDYTNENTQLVVNFLDRVHIERVFDITVDVNWLIKKIETIKPVLVIVDSLRAGTLNSSAGENTNEFGKLVYRLQQVFNFTNTCGVVIHHMNKTSGNGSMITKVSGHGSIAAATSGIIGLTSEETERGRVMTLKTLPRDGTSITIKYILQTNDDGLWKLEKVFEDTPLSSPITSRILRFLGDNIDQPYTFKQLAKELQYSGQDNNFKLCLKYLQTNRIITSIYNKGLFKYFLPQDSLWLVNPENIKELLTPAAIDANNLLKLTTKREIRELLTDWDNNRQTLAAKELSKPERKRIEDLVKSWEFSIGDEVYYQNNIHIIENIVNENPSLFNNLYKISDVEIPVLEQDLNTADKEIYEETDTETETETNEQEVELENKEDSFDIEFLE